MTRHELEVVAEIHGHDLRALAEGSKEMRDRLIVELYKAGEPVDSICAGLGVGRSLVFQVVRRSGIPRRNRPLSEETKAAIRAFYEEGVPLNMIAERIGMSRTAVNKALLRMGVERWRKGAAYREFRHKGRRRYVGRLLKELSDGSADRAMDDRDVLDAIRRAGERGQSEIAYGLWLTHKEWRQRNGLPHLAFEEVFG